MEGLVLREDWLGRTKEEILEPERPIVDPHFHFFVENELFPNYQLADLLLEGEEFGEAAGEYERVAAEASEPRALSIDSGLTPMTASTATLIVI